MNTNFLVSNQDHDNGKKVAIYVCEEFSPFHTSVPWLAFHDTNKYEDLFETFLFSDNKSILQSDNIFLINAAFGIEDAISSDTIIIPYWHDYHTKPSDGLVALLRQASRQGKLIVGLSSGIYVLGYAGLLDGVRVSANRYLEKDLVGRFPKVRLDTNAVYVDDSNIITSAGVAASMDCCLYIIKRIYGSVIADRVARLMLNPSYDSDGDVAKIGVASATTTSDIAINHLLGYLKTHLHEATGVEALAVKAGMSRRTFTRRFQAATGTSVIKWLTTQRLQYALELLEITDFSVRQISRKCGFVSEASFRYAFFNRFNVSPKDWRRQFKTQRQQGLNIATAI